MIAFIERRRRGLVFGRQSTRFGTTMIEVLVLISVSSILMTVVAVWLHKLLLFSSTLMERQRDHVNFNHLATALRQDVMFAKSWSFPNPTEPNHLELAMADNSKIQYQLVHQDHGTKIIAIHVPASDEKEDPAKTAKPPVRQEVYRFSPSCRLAWERAELPQSLTLSAYRVPMLADPLPKTSFDIKTAANPQAVLASPKDSTAQFNSAAIETFIRLTPNRWTEPIHRVLEDSP
jgi:hypothetical protein